MVRDAAESPQGNSGKVTHMNDPYSPNSQAGELRPKHLDLKKEHGLIVEWGNGRVSVFPIQYLRKMSPSADARVLREEMARNPLTVLPSSPASGDTPLTATGAELVGNYAIQITFSDGHDTGIYSWNYLREIDPSRKNHENKPQ